MSYRPFRKLYKPSVWTDTTLQRIIWKVPSDLGPTISALLQTLEWEPEDSEEWQVARDQLLSLPGFPHKEIGFPNTDPRLHLVIEVEKPVKSLPGVTPPRGTATLIHGDDAA